ncbi:MAG: hypothetical protein U5J78_02250 [Parasphingorhabdus sp.]|nr:hypothetical protein [Parasphingorhabdus sp.]
MIPTFPQALSAWTDDVPYGQQAAGRLARVQADALDVLRADHPAMAKIGDNVAKGENVAQISAYYDEHFASAGWQKQALDEQMPPPPKDMPRASLTLWQRGDSAFALASAPAYTNDPDNMTLFVMFAQDMAAR